METVKPLDQRQEAIANPRQQDKIIKVLESGDLNAINQSAATVSDAERASFRSKVVEGKVDGVAIDDKVIKSIAAPFSGQDGMRELFQHIQSNPDTAGNFSARLKESIHRNFVQIEGGGRGLREEDLADFVAAFPTPRLFDETFIVKRREDLMRRMTATKPESGDASLLRMELKNLQEREATVYPRFKAAIYGKRNEYWEQGKLLLRASGKNSVDPIVDDIPARPQERAASFNALPSREQMIESDLAYQDAQLSDDVKRRTLDWSKTSESAQRYADSLLQLSQRETLEAIRNLARKILDTMLAEATRIGMPITTYGRSMSWAMWDIGKQYHFFTHPDQIEPGYEETGNPLESQTKQDEIINRHLGWEAYAAFSGNVQGWREKVERDPKFTPALELLSKPPKQNNTLSSKDLADLGRTLRAIR